MRSTIHVSLLLVLVIVAIVGGVVVYSPDHSQSVDIQTDNQTKRSIEDVSNTGPTSVSAPLHVDNATAINPVDYATGAVFDPTGRSNDVLTMPTPVPANAIDKATQRSWSGYVFSAVDQKPMAGVTVSLNGQANAVSREGDGFFTTKLPREIQSVSARFSYSGYHSVSGTLKRDHNQNVFFMVPEGALFVDVVDNSSRPVLYAQIEIKSNSGFWSKTVTADMRGRYFEPNPPKAGLTISASYHGYTDQGQATKTIEPPFSDKVTLQLHRPYFSISGRVIERDTQKGVEQVSLTASNTIFLRQEYASTDKTGYYEFTNLLTASYTIELAPRDTSFHVAHEQRTRVVRVIDKHARDVNFELVRGYSISGTVVDANGSPVPDAKVYLTPHPSNPPVFVLNEEQIATTDAQGQFTLYNLPPTSNKESRVAAVHTERGSGVSEPFDPGAGQAGPFTITLGGLSTVEGIVVDDKGAAVPGAMVALHSPDQSLLGVLQQQTNTTTGQEGEFSITLAAVPSSSDKAPLSTYPFKIVAALGALDRDMSKVQYVEKRIELKPGESKNITLVLPTQKGVIRGRVTDQSGAPLQHTGVIARHQRYGLFQANTDENGVYAFGKPGDDLTATAFLPEGVYDLEFVGPGNPTQRGRLYQVKTGTLNADIVLSPNVWRVSGGVIDADTQQPLHHFNIYVESAPTAARAQPYLTTVKLNSHDGTYEVPFFEPGRYRLRFYADGYDTQAAVMTVVDDSREIQILNVKLTRTETTGSIYGQFVAPTGAPLGKVEVVGIGVYEANNNMFNIENLPPGRHDLVFYLFEIASQSFTPLGVLTSVTVQPGGRTQIGPVSAANLQTRYFDL